MAATATFDWSVPVLRLPTVVGMTVLVGAMWATGVVLHGRAAGLLAATLALLSAGLVDAGSEMWLENLVAPLFAVVLLAYGWAATTSDRLRHGAVAASGVGIALAILTKQVFGLLVLPGIVGIEIAAHRPKSIARLLMLGATVALFAGWWFVATYAQVGDETYRLFPDVSASPRFTTRVRPRRRHRTSRPACSTHTTARSNFSDVSSAIPSISYDHNSENAYDDNSAVNNWRERDGGG